MNNQQGNSGFGEFDFGSNSKGLQVGNSNGYNNPYNENDGGMSDRGPVSNIPLSTGWNFGALSLGLYFAVGTRTYKTLIPSILLMSSWIPFLGLLASIAALIVAIICGKKAEKWAWESGRYSDAGEFRAVMDSWNRAGIVSFIIGCVSLLALAIWIAFIGFSLGNIR